MGQKIHQANGSGSILRRRPLRFQRVSASRVGTSVGIFMARPHPTQQADLAKGISIYWESLRNT